MEQDDTSDQRVSEVGDSMRHLGRLSAWVAHEVNNSLGGIHTSFALLQRLIPADHPHFRYVAAIEREIARSSGLTERVLSAYEFDVELQSPIPIGAALQDAVRAMAPLCRARNVAISITPPAEAGLNADCSSLGRLAIRHLIRHAVESAENGGVVQVSAASGNGRLRVTIPHRPTDPSDPKWPMAGPRGLALSIVKQLAHALDGELLLPGIDSTGEIHLSLPMHVTQAEDPRCSTKG